MKLKKTLDDCCSMLQPSEEELESLRKSIEEKNQEILKLKAEIYDLWNDRE